MGSDSKHGLGPGEGRQNLGHDQYPAEKNMPGTSAKGRGKLGRERNWDCEGKIYP